MELLEEHDDDSVCEKLEEFVELVDDSINIGRDELVNSPDDMGVDCNDEDDSAVEDDMNNVDASDDMYDESDCFDVAL